MASGMGLYGCSSIFSFKRKTLLVRILMKYYLWLDICQDY